MDLLASMRTFNAVFEHGSFTAAAEHLGISKALTSKYIAQLENHLDARLINRTTRKLNFTEVGQAYYLRCKELLDELDELESAVQQQQSTPKGTLRIAAPINLGEGLISQVLADYLKRYSNVSIDLVLADRFVNLVDEGFDLAIRVGQLSDSTLIARKLAQINTVLCASPEYLAINGKPETPDDLNRHNCIIDTNINNSETWSFHQDNHSYQVKVSGQFRANSAESVHKMLLQGSGIGMSPSFVVNNDIQNGELKQLLSDYQTSEYGIYVVYPHNRHLAAKVRTLIDFLVDFFRNRTLL